MTRSSPAAFAVRFAIVFALLITWAFGIGRYGGPDEPAHVIRSYAAAHGDLLGDSADPLPAGYRFVDVPARLAAPDPACYRHDSQVTSRCAEDDPDLSGMRRVGTSAGTTPPLYHVLIGSIVRVVGDPADTASYRFAAALLHAVVVALALTRIRHRATVAVLALAALTPATWFLFGVVNPNSLEIALAFLAWIGVVRAIDRSAAFGSMLPADVWWIAAPVALAVAVRPIAIVVLMAVVAVVEIRCRPSWQQRVRLVAPTAVSIVALLLWNLSIRIQIDDERTAVHRSLLRNVADATASLPHTAAEAVGSLGWYEFDAPLVATLGWAVLVALAVVAWRESLATGSVVHRPPWLASAAWLAAVVLTPVVFEVVLAGRIGPIWQGRYSLPVLIGLPAVSSSSSTRTTSTTPSRTRPQHVAVVVTILALVETTTYWATVRRYAVGTNGSWWLSNAYQSTSWLGPREWMSIHAVAVVAVTVASTRTVTAPPSEAQTM